MTTKKSLKKASNPIKFCSDRCRSRKPGAADKRIEQAITALLNDEEDSGIERTAAHSRRVKGDPRIVVTCDEIEEIVFGSRFDPEKVYGRRKNRKSRAIGNSDAEWRSVDMEDDGPLEASKDMSITAQVNGVHIRLPQDEADVNFSVGGERGRTEKIEPSAEDIEKRRQGDKRAEEREMVRRATRRVIVFGVSVPCTASSTSNVNGKARAKQDDINIVQNSSPDSIIRKAEALMNGVVVEPSFAKGNWSIRYVIPEARSCCHYEHLLTIIYMVIAGESSMKGFFEHIGSPSIPLLH
jgi:hypothetical protein